MARTPPMAGDWKMNLNYLEVIQSVNQLHLDLADHHHDFNAVEVTMTPPFTDIRPVQTTINGGNMKICYGAQGMSIHDSGASTDEVSTAMLIRLGCTYVVMGHPERHEYHSETDMVINTKTYEVLAAGIAPIVCCDEALDVHKAGKHVEHVLSQIAADFADISTAETEKYVVAHKPIWAIGTGETATPQDAQEVCGVIRQKLAEVYNAEITDKMHILHGGSAEPINVVDIMAEPDTDGGLVGDVSLKAEEFGEICRIGK